MLGASRSYNIVSVNTSDDGGGAEQIAWSCFKGYQQSGHRSTLIVGNKKSADEDVVPFFQSPHIKYRKYAKWPRASWLAWKTQRDQAAGRENFNFPYTKYLARISGQRPDLIHLHNLHGPYFDLRVLAKLSGKFPLFWTLHDSWALTGHCAYPNGCSRWETGCGDCPDLTLPPAIECDATHDNSKRKRSIYARSRLYVAAPSRWLIDRVNRSILEPGIVEQRVIPNGIDQSLFKTASKQKIRCELGIPIDARVMMFAAHGAINNPYKDCETVRQAIIQVAERMKECDLRFFVVGEEAAPEVHGSAVVQYISFLPRDQLVKYYQASDLYLHAAIEDNFPTVIIEAMSCGIPVVATATGGIPEMVTHREHGLLVPGQAPDAMAAAIEWMLRNEPAREIMGRNASATARTMFCRDRMIADYLDWFGGVLEQQKGMAA